MSREQAAIWRMRLAEQPDLALSPEYLDWCADHRELADKADEVAALFDRLGDLKPDTERAGRAPIKRAVGNLLSALWHRVSHEEMDEDTLHQIAAVLDEAAQKIERLK